jgi:hypothetical protein
MQRHLLAITANRKIEPILECRWRPDTLVSACAEAFHVNNFSYYIYNYM